MSCSKQEDTVVPVVAKDPQNLKVELIENKAVVSWDVQANESYSFQLAEDEKYTDVIFNKTEKKKMDAVIEIDDSESFVNHGKVTFINVPVNQKFYFRVRAEIINEKTFKSTSYSNYSKVNFLIEDNTKPAIPTTKVDSNQISFSSFNIGFPEDFDPQNHLDIKLEISKDEAFSESVVYDYYPQYGANAINLDPITKYYYRVIPSDINGNVRASEALTLTTHSIAQLETAGFDYLSTGGGPAYFTLIFRPQAKDSTLIKLATEHHANIHAVTEASTSSSFESNVTQRKSVEVDNRNTPFAYLKTIEALGSKIYGRTYLNTGNNNGNFSNTVIKEMPNAVASIDNEVVEFIKESTSTSQFIHLKSTGGEEMELQISLLETLKEGKNDIIFSSSSNNKFSVIRDGIEYNSKRSFTITLIKSSNSVTMNESVDVISLESTDSKHGMLNLIQFGLGLR
ncbi:hypothetical protein AVL50_09205 [Flammeovirga sp. SJP92]|nr:hypothetical protein AVL50_09205 [Flammeovirga sp. SJP92]